MDRNIKKIISISAIVLLSCGWSGLVTLWTVVKDIFVAFFPFIVEGVKNSVEDYLASPRFITGIIMFILSSCFGIWIGRTGGRIIYLIISIIVALASLASIGANLL